MDGKDDHFDTFSEKLVTTSNDPSTNPLTSETCLVFGMMFLGFLCTHDSSYSDCVLIGGDVSELSLSFVVTSEGKDVPLLPNGQDVPVTAENRVRYIYLYPGGKFFWGDKSSAGKRWRTFMREASDCIYIFYKTCVQYVCRYE